MKKIKSLLIVFCLSVTTLLLPQHAYSVGPGVVIGIEEIDIPGSHINSVIANSFDFTYKSCSKFQLYSRGFREKGFIWVSSFQFLNDVVKSQLNYYLDSGYRIYGLYQYAAQRKGPPQKTPTGTRLNYVVNKLNPSFTLYIDVAANTRLNMSGQCLLSRTNFSDDIKLGTSTTILQGEKTETDGFANGDFKIMFDNWIFFPDKRQENSIIDSHTTAYRYLTFSGNTTYLRSGITTDHFAEGSGILYWRVRLFQTETKP